MFKTFYSPKAAGLLLALTLTAAACGGGSAEKSDDAITSLSGATPSTGQTDDTGAGARAEEVGDAGIFTQTVDGRGSGGVLSIDQLEGGQPGLDPHAGSVEDFGPEDFENIIKDCEKHLANTGQGFDLSPDEQAAQLEFTECKRELGINLPDFEDDGITIQSSGEGEVDPKQVP